MTENDQKQLGKTLWSIADQLRGAMNADDFRDHDEGDEQPEPQLEPVGVERNPVANLDSCFGTLAHCDGISGSRVRLSKPDPCQQFGERCPVLRDRVVDVCIVHHDSSTPDRTPRDNGARSANWSG